MFVLMICILITLLSFIFIIGMGIPLYQSYQYSITSCELLNKQVLTFNIEPELYDPFNSNSYNQCHSCTDDDYVNHSKNCEHMQANNITGKCCLHLSWYGEDCCNWETTIYTTYDSNNKPSTYYSEDCVQYSDTRVAFIHNKVYDVKFDVKISTGDDCKKQIHCHDFGTMDKCVEEIMNKNYEKSVLLQSK